MTSRTEEIDIERSPAAGEILINVRRTPDADEDPDEDEDEAPETPLDEPALDARSGSTIRTR